MEYVQMTLNDWIEIKQKLKRELLGIKQSFVRIGYALRQIDDQKLYERDGYKSVAEFAKAEYGLEASTTSRFMSINREYSIDGYSERLRPEYADLGRSQLEEMLKLPDSDRQMIQPDTSREDIRELKRFNKTEPEKRKAEEDTEQQEHSQWQEEMTDTADENDSEQEEPEPSEDEKELEENCQNETVEEPVKTEIAPAQKSEETQENQGMDEPVSEDHEAENETLKVEKVEAPYETRKEYMDSLSTYELAGYLADEYRIQCKKEMDLGQQEKVYEWLKQRVDGYGKAVEENEED
ncbi:hypothetical protein [Eubacterium ramulus]|uniref:hypothetical protein n=1 Tax=Eubacterium ramulus TaxID=39490 RepID=UPI0035A302AF